MPTYLLLMFSSVLAVLPATLALIARRRARAPVGRSVTDDLDDLVELEAHAQAVAAAAQQAIAAADEAHHRAERAVQALDLAGWHYRQVRQQAAEHPLRLAERAALNAFRRGQLSVAELDRIWHYTQATAAGWTNRADRVPAEWDSQVHAARERYEQAAIEVTDVHKQAQVTTIAAGVLAEESDLAESDLTAAQRSTSTGLAALLLGGVTRSSSTGGISG